MSRHRSCFSVNRHIFSRPLALLFAFIMFSLLASGAQAGQANLAWDACTGSGLAGYKVYVGSASKNYQSSLDVGNKTTATVTNLQEGSTYYFAVTAYNTSRNESSYSNEVTYRVPAACTYTASPTSQSFASSGGTGRVSVTTAAGCAWTAVSNASWITITSNVSVTGSGTTNYSVSANTGASSRTGTMTIAGRTVTISQTGSQSGTASQYTLTLTKAGTGNGTLSNSPTGSTFNAGTTVRITASPDANSTFAGWSGSCTGTSTTCTLTMNANAAVTATFNSKSSTITITATAGANGTISPSGSVSVNSGANRAFTITPNSGYRIADVRVDGASVGAVSSYSFTNVTAAHTIAATFTAASSSRSYTITATAGANGTISPSGAVSVSSGTNRAFTITPNSGYRIADVKVDGTSVGAVSTYSFTNVTAAHTIAATFTSSAATQPGSLVAALNAGGGSYTAKSGVNYMADTGYQGGGTGKSSASIAGTDDDILYQTERNGNFSYAAPIANGNYFVTLKFAETYWSSSNRRIFNVKIQGRQVITNLDLFAKAGMNRAYDVTLPITVSNGVMKIEFVSVKDNAKVNAIMVQKAQ